MLHLCSTTFKGNFQRNPEAVAKELKQYEADPASYNPEVLKRIQGDQAAYPFKINFFYHNPETGLFITEGYDEAGQSGIYGKLDDEDMVFSKGYPRDGFRISEGGTLMNQAVRRFDYEGTRQGLTGSPLTYKGTYSMPGHGKHMNGTWELSQVKE